MHANTERSLKRVEIVRELAGKQPVWFIAEKLNTSPEAVATLALTHKISLAFVYKKWGESAIATLKQMRRDGCTFGQIGVALGRSEQNCAGRYRKIPMEDR